MKRKTLASISPTWVHLNVVSKGEAPDGRQFISNHQRFTALGVLRPYEYISKTPDAPLRSLRLNHYSQQSNSISHFSIFAQPKNCLGFAVILEFQYIVRGVF